MAVRAFDLAAEQSAPQLVEVPTSRQSVRRTRHRSALVAACVLTVPFVAAIIVLEVAH